MKAIDDYIEKAQPFAQPVLLHLRNLIHQTCPNVEEKIKWGMPFFDYLGPFVHFASFKQHCVMGFWKASLMKDASLLNNASKEDSMGHFGGICSLKDLPADKKIIAYLKEAMALNEKGIKVNRVKTNASDRALEAPDYFIKALKKQKPAFTVFEAFSASAKKEYITWITEAKSEATREKRLTQAIEWISEGKRKNWKYEKC